jgi:chemotaxis protein MotB
MALTRRSTSAFDIWPGFVDALATLLMVIIFLLMIFVVAQFYLSDILVGRDEALERLNRQVAEMADLLALERRANDDLRSSVAQLSAELQSSLTERDKISNELSALHDLRDSLTGRLAETEEKLDKTEAERAKLGKELEDAFKVIEADREKIEIQMRQLAELQQDIIAMRALRDELAKDLETARGDIASARSEAESAKREAESAKREAEKKGLQLTEERKISAAAKAQLALLNRQMAALRKQLTILNAALEASEARDKEQQAKIADLGRRLNVALASKVQELARYRSEFFGRLREVLGNRPDIAIVGDRFVFQSEVLFASGSAELGARGKEQLHQLANTLKEIAARIPEDLNWVLRVDGHTDKIPIKTDRFPSNWELSTARAISVVKFLIADGIPPQRLAAAGFGEFQPLDDTEDEIAYRRNRRIELKLDQR